jgi:hypothetical protein
MARSMTTPNNSSPQRITVQMPLDVPEVVTRLERDVVRTLGESYRELVRDAAATVALLAIADPGEKIVQDVQQHIHDTYVDTNWPTCPRHRTHPVWYADGAWVCEQDHAIVAALGDLGQSSRPAG